MSTIHLGRGSIVVEYPDDDLVRGLGFFRHRRNGDGEYEQLYTLSEARHLLVTLPGFAKRCEELSDSPRVVDDRRPLPDPDVKAAVSGLDPVWAGAMSEAIASGGGIVSVPDMLGYAHVIASILRAFPKEPLAARGTPLSIVAAKDYESAKTLGYELRAMIPDREIGVNHSDSDDIIVAAYGILDDLPRHLAGVFIGMDACEDSDSRADKVSGIRDAARWGVVTSPFGGPVRVDLRSEGLFGGLVSSVSYDDAVRSGLGAPVTVCWMQSPKPNVQPGSAPVELLSANAMQENPAFIRMVADILRQTAGNIGCLISVDTVAMADRLSSISPETACISARLRKGERDAIMEGIDSGTIRKAIVVKGISIMNPSHDVVVMATCGAGDAVGMLIPWRPAAACCRSYIVEFSHPWDIHNGRPGILALNDESRRKRYHDLGFRQVTLSHPSELPFVGG